MYGSGFRVRGFCLQFNGLLWQAPTAVLHMLVPRCPVRLVTTEADMHRHRNTVTHTHTHADTHTHTPSVWEARGCKHEASVPVTMRPHGSRMYTLYTVQGFIQLRACGQHGRGLTQSLRVQFVWPLVLFFSTVVITLRIHVPV